MVPVLEVRGLRKRYPGGDGFVLGADGDGVCFDVQQGEVFALLGPSGCGKTTTLRIVGGLLPADAGTVLVDGADITARPAHARPTNTVFQDYALFPHLSVGANVGFGLSVDGVPRQERRRRVAQTLELVGLAGAESRRIAELSGGQQQRVALARALVKRPRVVLLDEPLGALDLKLRRQLQSELTLLKESTGATFVHVTHDQEEACAIADRIAVMKDGAIVQIDRPYELFQRPRSTYVAEFLHAGTILRGRTERRGGFVEIVTDDLTVRREVDGAPMPERVAALVPTASIEVHGPDGALDPPSAVGTLTRLTFTGNSFVGAVSVSPTLEFAVNLSVARRAELGADVEVGRRVELRWRPEDLVLIEAGDIEAGD
jgi:ABC-type Fe3+/spermidine/putrescine transport system ATPase subunit